MGNQPFLVERTHLEATAAPAALGVGHAIGRAFGDIRLPHLIAVEHHLVAERDRIAGTFDRAFPALGAEILQPEINRPIDRHRHIGGDYRGFEAGTDKGVKHHFADPAELAQPGLEHQRDMQHVAVEIGMGLCVPAKLTDIFGNGTGGVGAPHIGPERLGVGNPVIARCGIQRLEALIDQHDDGVTMARRHLAAVGIVRIPGVVGHLADTDRIGLQEIAERLEMLGNRLGIVGQRRLFRQGLALVHPVMFLAHGPHRPCEGDLADEAGTFALGAGPQIAGRRAIEEIGPFGHTRNIVGNIGRGFRDAADLFHRVAAEMHLAAAAREKTHECPPKAGLLTSRQY